MRVLAGEVVGVFAHVERADQNRAGRLEPRRQGRVGAGGSAVAIDLRSRSRRQAVDVEQVLDRERRARERAERFAPRAPAGVDRGGLGERALGGDVGEGAELGVERLDALERRLDDFARARLAADDGGANFQRADRVRGEAHAVYTGAGSASSSSGKSPRPRAIAARRFPDAA